MNVDILYGTTSLFLSSPNIIHMDYSTIWKKGLGRDEEEEEEEAPAPRDRTQDLTQQACRELETPGSDGVMQWNWEGQRQYFYLCLYRRRSSAFPDWSKPGIDGDALPCSSLSVNVAAWAIIFAIIVHIGWRQVLGHLYFLENMKPALLIPYVCCMVTHLHYH